MATTQFKLRQLQQDGASTDDYLKFNGTNWAPAAFSGVDGSGAAGRVAYWSDSDTLTSDAEFTYNGTTDVLTVDDLTIDGSNSTLYTTSGILQLKGTSAATLGTILLSEITGNAIVFSTGTSTATSGIINRITNNGAFSPTSGSGVHNWITIAPTINQTGGSTGISRGLNIEPTLTSVADFRGVELNYSNAAAWGIYQSGASTKNYLAGNTGIGTSSISQTLHVQGTARITGSDGTPTSIMGRDGDGDISAVSLGSTLSLSGGTLGVSTTGVVLVGGNTLAGQLTIGTNDANTLALETNNVTRLTISGGASTGGNVVVTTVSSLTNNVEPTLTLRVNSSGSATTDFGNRLLFQGETTTTDNQDMFGIDTIWSTATHASRTAYLRFVGVNNAGALAEAARLTAAGVLSVGTSSQLAIASTSMTTAANYTIGNSAQTLALTSSAASATALTGTASSTAATITLDTSGAARSTTTAGIRLQTTSYTTAGTSLIATAIGGGYAPSSSGTSTYTALTLTPTINQTGGHTGLTYGIRVNPTLTAVGGTFYGLDLPYNSASAYGINQTGASVRNRLQGKTGIGQDAAASSLSITLSESTAVDTYGINIANTITSTANNAESGGVSINAIHNNAGGLTNNAVYGIYTGVTSGNSNAATTISSLNGARGFVTNYADAADQFYGAYFRCDERAPTANLNNRVAGRFEMQKFVNEGDAHTMTGLQGSVQDQTTAGRILTGTGMSFSAANAKTGFGAVVTVSNSRGTANTQYGHYINNNSSTAGTVVDNAYGLFLSTAAASSSVITNYYGIYQNATPSGATLSYMLYSANATNRSYHNGLLSIGVDSTAAKLTVRGTGTTSSTTALIVEKSDGTDVLNVRDDGRVGILDSTPAYPLDVNGESAMHHIYSNSGTPSNSLGGSTIVGTGASAAITGGDIGMNVSLTTGTGISAAGTITTITYAIAYGTAPAVAAFPKNAATAAMFKNAELWLETTSTTVVVKSTNNLTNSTTYNFDIVVIGRIAA